MRRALKALWAFLTRHRKRAQAYCATCRKTYWVRENPPYAVIHRMDGTHLHPISRAPVKEVDS